VGPCRWDDVKYGIAGKKTFELTDDGMVTVKSPDTKPLNTFY